MRSRSRRQLTTSGPIICRGAADGSSEIVKSYYSNYSKTHPNSAYYSWKQLSELVKDINETAEKYPGDPINVIGHSYGGDTAAAAALQACGKIDLLITIDPVSRFHSRDLRALSRSVDTWIDVNGQGGGAFQFDNLVAGLGGSWNGGPNGVASLYIEDHFSSHGDFRQMMNASGPGVNSPAQVLGGAPMVNPPFINR